MQVTWGAAATLICPIDCLKWRHPSRRKGVACLSATGACSLETCREVSVRIYENRELFLLFLHFQSSGRAESERYQSEMLFLIEAEVCPTQNGGVPWGGWFIFEGPSSPGRRVLCAPQLVAARRARHCAVEMRPANLQWRFFLVDRW